MCKSGGTFCFSKTAFDENVKALLTPHLKSMDNEFDPSEPYYVLSKLIVFFYYMTDFLFNVVLVSLVHT